MICHQSVDAWKSECARFCSACKRKFEQMVFPRCQCLLDHIYFFFIRSGFHDDEWQAIAIADCCSITKCVLNLSKWNDVVCKHINGIHKLKPNSSVKTGKIIRNPMIFDVLHHNNKNTTIIRLIQVCSLMPSPSLSILFRYLFLSLNFATFFG